MPKLRDWEIREALLSRLTDEFKEDAGAIIVSEFTFHDGAARADMAVINGAFHGYEIKSDVDSLSRLPRQASYYEQSFNYVTVIVTDRLLEGSRDCIPAHFGIERAFWCPSQNCIKFATIRRAKASRKISPQSLVRMLWRDELLELLEEDGLDKGVRTKPKYDLFDIAATRLASSRLSDRVRSTIQSRADWRPDAIRL